MKAMMVIIIEFYKALYSVITLLFKRSKKKKGHFRPKVPMS